MSIEARKEILELLAQGKINAAEAAEMLTAVKASSIPIPPDPPVAAERVADEPEPETAVPTPKAAPNGQKPSWFRIRVSNLETGKNKVSVNIPLRMIKFGVSIAQQFTPDLPFTLNEFDTMLANEESGLLVDVRDEDSNEHVQIYLE